MSISSEQFKEKVKSLVRAHYETEQSPLLLAHLGVAIEKENAWPDDRNGRGLKRLLRDLLYPELDLIWDERSPEFIAVVTPDVRAKVLEQIERRQKSADNTLLLERIARSILLAFCIYVPGEEPVYVRRSPPFRYELKPPDPEVAGQYLIVEPEYRRPGLRIDRLDQLDPADRTDLSERIKNWAAAHGVAVEQFFHSDEARLGAALSDQTALDRLVAAQLPEIARRLLIPADIAQMLARHR